MLKLVTGASKVHKLVFCDVSSLLVNHTPKKYFSQTLNKGVTRLKKSDDIWEQLGEHMGTYDYI
jgi:hypothetical protein